MQPRNIFWIRFVGGAHRGAADGACWCYILLVSSYPLTSVIFSLLLPLTSVYNITSNNKRQSVGVVPVLLLLNNQQTYK